MAGEEDDKGRIIQELITHINSVEQKVGMLKDGIDEQNDLQTVNRLDIMNLKNEIDKIKATLPIVSEEMAGKLKSMEKLLGGQANTDDVKVLVSEMEKLRKRVGELEPRNMEAMEKRILELHNALKRMPPDYGKELVELRSGLKKAQDFGKDVAELKRRAEKPQPAKSVPTCKGCGALSIGARKFCGKCGKRL